MKSTSICPKCDGRYCDAGGTLKPFNLTGTELAAGKKGVFGGDAKEREMEMAGPLDAYVCAGCGYVERHMPQAGLRMLQRLFDAGEGVRLVPAPAADPFRRLAFTT